MGVPYDADLETIREAYRALVRAYHPDLNGGVENPRLRDVTEAWDVLRESSARRAHRSELRSRMRRTQRRAHNTRGMSAATAEKQPFKEAVLIRLPAGIHGHGGQLKTRVPVRHRCPSCRGQTFERKQCQLCDGSGELTMMVRGRVNIPPYIPLGKPLPLEFELELFGLTRMRAIVKLV